jgi:hypothetical protein
MLKTYYVNNNTKTFFNTSINIQPVINRIAHDIAITGKYMKDPNLAIVSFKTDLTKVAMLLKPEVYSEKIEDFFNIYALVTT